MLIKTLLLACAAFAGTNIDDLFINMFFFSTAESAVQKRQIVLGKYLGMGILTAVSMLGALGLQQLNTEYLSLLGVIPVGLGIRQIVVSLRGHTEDDKPAAASRFLWLGMTLMTIANGADNVGVYLPLFSAFSIRQMILSTGVFAVMTGLSCVLADCLSALPLLSRLLEAHRQRIVPAVYLILGLYILFF